MLWFQCEKGVRQGDTLSPTLFSIFINDLVSDINNLSSGIKFENNEISILLYADDVVLLSDSHKNLQTMLNTLHNWCTKWKVYINQEKSSIIHFRKPQVTRCRHAFKVGSQLLKYVEHYKYLGTYFSEFSNFDKNTEIYAESGRRALGAIISKLKKNNFMGYSTYTKLYNACVVPVLDYGSEVWGFKPYTKHDIVQNKAMRVYLGVHRFAPVAGMEGDMAWFAPQYRRWINILRFWNHVINMDGNRLVKSIFEWSYIKADEGITNWCSGVSCILSDIGKSELYLDKQPVDLKECRTLLLQMQSQKWTNVIATKTKLRFYIRFKTTFEPEKYVKINLSHSERSVLAQTRLGILPLHVETGRFTNTPLNDRTCVICQSNAIEDEFHFLFECDAYDELRNEWLETALIHCPDFYYLEINDQLTFLFGIIPRPTAKFIKSCLTIRKSILYN